ncbi:hypothetical protein MTO96_004832 [Rhipicephalus appendiculatus]
MDDVGVTMSSKWTQVAFVVTAILGAYVFNRQRVGFYTFEPPLDERIPCAAVPSSKGISVRCARSSYLPRRCLCACFLS